MDEPITYTLREVAARTRISWRFIVDECRAERLDHINRGGRRRMTPQQVDAMLAKLTVKAGKPRAAQLDPDQEDRLRAERRARRAA